METKLMRILHLTARADFGGGPEHVHALLRHLPEWACCHVACPRDYPYWERFQAEVGPERMVEIPHRRLSFRRLWLLRLYVLRNGIGLLHSHGKGAGLYSRPLSLLTGVPCLHTYHGLHDRYRWPLSWLYHRLEAILALLTARAIAVSEGEAASLLAAGVCPSWRLSVIRNGVPLPEETAAPPRPGQPAVVVTMTRYNKQKNPELLMQIINKLQDSRMLSQFVFEVLGTGPQQEAVASQIASRGQGAQVRLRGPVCDPKAALRNAHIYLSTSRWEGLPLAVLEAMSAGVPVVATDVAGNADAVQHGKTGFLYRSEEPEAAVQRLVELSRDAELWVRCGMSGRERVASEFSVKEMAEAVARLYAEVAGH